MTRQTEDVRPVDMEIGGDDDMPGIAQELTTDDIDDLALDSDSPIEERRARLIEIRDELRTRRASDMLGDQAALLDYVEDRLADIGAPVDRDGFLEGMAMDSDSRFDAHDPADFTDEEAEAARDDKDASLDKEDV
jgi:hypothetical protein